MRNFVFYLRSVDGNDLNSQREACHRLAGGDGEVLAEFIEIGADTVEKLLEALDLSSRNGATFVAAP